jgi:hypothetical protein
VKIYTNIDISDAACGQGQLLAEWEIFTNEYRAVFTAEGTNINDGRIVIEQKQTDAMGNTCWLHISRDRFNDTYEGKILYSLLKAMLDVTLYK